MPDVIQVPGNVHTFLRVFYTESPSYGMNLTLVICLTHGLTFNTTVLSLSEFVAFRIFPSVSLDFPS